MTKKIRILIVEDEALVAEDLKEMLLGYGYEVPAIAATAKKRSPLRMNTARTLSSWTSTYRVDRRDHRRGRDPSRWGIPIIYVTAFATPAIIERAKKTTPSGYILKPFNERQIQTAIEIALYNSALEKQLKEHDATISTLINATSNLLILIDTQGIIRDSTMHW